MPANSQEALENLSMVARSVEANSRKRRSFKAFLTDSLGRRKKGAKKDRTQSCSESGFTEADESNLVKLVRSASLDPKKDSRILQIENQYYNEGAFARPLPVDQPPKPPERLQSLPRLPKHVFHESCRKGQFSNLDQWDIVVVFSSLCSISDRWCRYFARLFNSDRGRLRIVPQPIETLSDLVTEDPDSDHLAKLEEKMFHANVQILILSPTMIGWAGHNSHLVLNQMLDVRKAITVLLGVERDPKFFHQASKSTVSLGRDSDSSAAIEKLFADAMDILRLGKMSCEQNAAPPPLLSQTAAAEDSIFNVGLSKGQKNSSIRSLVLTELLFDNPFS